MVLIDTSVWVDYFNGVANPQTDHLDFLLGQQPVALGDLVMCEVLQGFRHEKDFKKARYFFEKLPFYQLGGYSICLKASEHFRFLRKNGVTIRKTIDIIIATACVEYDLKLLHNDRDFDAMEKIKGFQAIRL